MSWRFYAAQSGLSFIELVIALAILGLLASMVLPMAEMTVTRSKEIELRRDLREIRTALDAYKRDYDKAVVEKKIIANVEDSGYPKELAALVQGNDWGGMYPYIKKYLRRVPEDPFDQNDEGWGKRSYTDDVDADFWGGDDVYDVYSQSDRIALDGSFYRNW